MKLDSGGGDNTRPVGQNDGRNSFKKEESKHFQSKTLLNQQSPAQIQDSPNRKMTTNKNTSLQNNNLL